MSKNNFLTILQEEINRIEKANTTKRNENIISGYIFDPSPKALINNKKYLVFNSNDYLGLKFNKKLLQAEFETSEKYGVGPGSVRFISGTFQIYKDLEKAIANFHSREDAMIFSSAFAANIAVIFCLIKGQSKDSLVGSETLVVSDELNHRSIIEGIRVAGLPSEQKQIFKHLNYEDLSRILRENVQSSPADKKKYKRVVIITDGIFSMLGEYADLKKINKTAIEYDKFYQEGIWLIVDDSHGVGAFGKTGRGVEEVCETKADILVGTLGKAFGVDGGYVVGDKIVIDYFRESAATYIYSNPISPGSAGGALEAFNIMNQDEGVSYLKKLNDNISFFKEKISKLKLKLAPSNHPIQPILIGDANKTRLLKEELFKNGILVTSINYPVVPPGKDEIRVQISASHTTKDLEYFISELTKAGKKLGLILANS